MINSKNLDIHSANTFPIGIWKQVNYPITCFTYWPVLGIYWNYYTDLYREFTEIILLTCIGDWLKLFLQTCIGALLKLVHWPLQVIHWNYFTDLCRRFTEITHTMKLFYRHLRGIHWNYFTDPYRWFIEIILLTCIEESLKLFYRPV